MQKKLIAIAVTAVWLALPTISSATSHSAGQAAGHSEHQAALTDGEVRKVDKEAKKLTIRHAPIANLDMPAMTMVFQVQDAAILDSVKAGDKIRFQAEKAGGAFTVTRVEPAK